MAECDSVAVLGGYDMEEKAARAYDLAALKYWGPSTHINFPVTLYFTSASASSSSFLPWHSHGNFVES